MSEARFEWADVPKERLDFASTLRSGQTFRWRERPCGEWLGPIGDLAVRIRPEAKGFWWQSYPEAGRWDAIHRYFALDADLPALYAEWNRREPRIAAAISEFAGLRIVRQDAEEAFFSFLCASCNTIVKITRTIRALESRYGEPIVRIDDDTFYRFPSAERLAGAREADLRSDLWGYRAPRVIEIARHVASAGPGWIESLRTMPYPDAHRSLTQFFGIGAKIADCICLFALWHDEAVPIDTHIRRIATQLYRPELSQKTLTPAVYRALGDLLRERFGPYAGWAQQYLFYADLQGMDIA